MTALAMGLGIGLAAGISPGPLLVLVITSTLRAGLRHGLAIACAPLLSDLVVVTATVATLGRIPPRWLSYLALAGGLLVVLVGGQTIREARATTLPLAQIEHVPAGRTLARGSLLNLLSPHPWISWLTVLGPLTISSWRAAPLSAVALVAGFYLTLVGSKVALAAVVAGSRHRLTEPAYRRIVVVAGLILLCLGVVMVADFVLR